jgi:hypothetical protein
MAHSRVELLRVVFNNGTLSAASGGPGLDSQFCARLPLAIPERLVNEV